LIEIISDFAATVFLTQFTPLSALSASTLSATLMQILMGLSLQMTSALSSIQMLSWPVLMMSNALFVID
jgi:hypothetical protein